MLLLKTIVIEFYVLVIYVVSFVIIFTSLIKNCIYYVAVGIPISLSPLPLFRYSILNRCNKRER